jgi:acyl-CoA synthetase (AMP-forming)/AMP-acid ligase II/acyl carrier protein
MSDERSGEPLPVRIGQHAEEAPDQHILSFLDAGLVVGESLTYQELDQRARSVAADLCDRGFAGRPVVLSLPPGLDFVTAFCGCLYAGSVAVPATLPRSNRASERLAAILADSGAPCVLTTAGHRDELSHQASGSGISVDVVAVDLVALDAAGGCMAPPAPDQLAFLQYTSGSTRSPRGVMVRHGDLSANLNSLRGVLGVDGDSVGISWLPVFHDMGLIAGVLLPLWVGYPTYLMAPSTFIRRPLSWLETFSRFRGTHGGAPNFAYQACVEAARAADVSTLDLASWRVAWNGAEPIRPDTLHRFRVQFAPNGFRPQSIAPGYGLAEATLVVSGGDGSKPAVELTVDESELHIGQVRLRTDSGPGAKRLAGSGRPGAGIEVRIVQPDVRRVAAPDALGEIWVRSNSVAQGYWRKPAETAETFDAYLATGEGPFLRTGDLGFLHDGELFVIGRLKDMIVIRGVNYYPHDIEYTVERSHPALQPDAGAVLGHEVGGRTGLVAVHEVRGDCSDSTAFDEVVDAVRRAVARDHQLPLQRVVLLHRGGLPKTSSGKVQRSKCRHELDAARLPIHHEWQMSEVAVAPLDVDTDSLGQPGYLERQLVAWMQRELALTDLTWSTPLTELGIDSLKGVELVNVLSAAFDRTFPATSMLDHPTVESLADLIRGATLGIDTGRRVRHAFDGHTDTHIEAQIDALDEREVAEALQRRIDEVLEGGRL